MILALSYRLMKEGQHKHNELFMVGEQIEGDALLPPGRFYLHAQALQRTGFVIFSAAVGSTVYDATELLREFGALSELEAVDPAELER